MTTPTFTMILVAAIARNGVIGANGDLAWRNREDLQRLKAMTMGHTLVMGRRNYDSIGRALPGRRTVVVTRQRDWAADDVTVVHDLSTHFDRVLADIVTSTGDSTVFIFGGAEIYEALLPRADILELTEIDVNIAGDVYFPPVMWSQWRTASRTQRDGFSWVRYERYAANTAADPT